MASYTSIHLAARPTPGPITKDFVVGDQVRGMLGLESSIDGLNLFFTGENRGKLIVKL